MLLAAASPLLAQRTGTPVQAGLWEILIETRTPSVVGVGPKATRLVNGVKVCFGDAQAADPVDFLTARVMPPARDCRPASVRQSGPRVTWTMSCPEGSNARGTASFDFSATRFSGTVRHERRREGEPAETDPYELRARRLSDC